MTAQGGDHDRLDARHRRGGVPEHTDLSVDAAGPGSEGGLSEATRPRIEGYRIVREISEGGQAVVYEGVQESTGQRVAVKVVRHGAFTAGPEKERFEREVRILAALEHPNIVHVIDRGVTAGGRSYLVMEYVEGVSLDEHLDEWHRRSGDVPGDPSELLRLFMGICEAVGAAHLRGVVHRDLKPTNIRIDTQGRPHILDFGLARTALGARTYEHGGRPVTVTGQFVGSLPYASPEQVEGVPSMIDARTDVYSLGVILYRMLTRQFPYKVVGSPRDVLDNILRTRPTPPSTVIEARLAKQGKRRSRRRKHRSPINPVIEAIVLKALAKKREDRYQSAGELSRDIASYLAGRPTVAAGAARRRSRPTIVAAGVVAMGCLGAVGVGLWHLANRSDPPEPAERSRAEPAERPAAAPSQVYTQWPFDAPEAKRRQTETAGVLGVRVAERIDLGSGVTMELALIPAGKFPMGSRFSPEETARKYGQTAKAFGDEHPRREVTITRPFYMAAHEVTYGQFSAFVGATGYRTQTDRDGWGVGLRGQFWIKMMRASWRGPGFRQTNRHPVVLVSWDDATAFCKWLSGRTGRRVALPTEAQWEYACRAGRATAYQWGDDPEGGRAWCNGYTPSMEIPFLNMRVHRRKGSDGRIFTALAGAYKKNAFGLCDMHGNVWEWCADYYAGTYYSAGGNTVDPSGPMTGAGRVVRGGAWSAALADCRSANRSCRPAHRCVTDCGFRVTVGTGRRRSAQ